MHLRVDEAMLSVAGFEKAKLAGYCVESKGVGFLDAREERVSVPWTPHHPGRDERYILPTKIWLIFRGKM